jgi:hypothetical protein
MYSAGGHSVLSIVGPSFSRWRVVIQQVACSHPAHRDLYSSGGHSVSSIVGPSFSRWRVVIQQVASSHSAHADLYSTGGRLLLNRWWVFIQQLTDRIRKHRPASLRRELHSPMGEGPGFFKTVRSPRFPEHSLNIK